MELPLLDELAGRFCYWRGRSGRRYIHTVYPSGGLPPLPGGVYIAVARDPFGRRRAVAAGRLSPLWELAERLPVACDEVHVHLLAASDAEAQAVVEDMRAALALASPQAFPTLPTRVAAVAA